WLKRASPETEAWRVSHETIYRSPLCTGPRRAEERAAGASAIPTANPALAPRNGEGRSAWPHPGRCLDQRATGVGRESGRTGPLGGRPALWIEEQLHRHIGRTPLALRDASQGREQGNANRRRCIDPASKEAARRTLQIPDLGSRQGTCRPQAVQHGNRYRRLLLLPAKPLAARLKRKHQSPAAPVLPKGP